MPTGWRVSSLHSVLGRTAIDAVSRVTAAYVGSHPIEKRLDAALRCARALRPFSSVHATARQLKPHARLEWTLERVAAWSDARGVEFPPVRCDGVELLRAPTLVLARHAPLTNRLVRSDLLRLGLRATFVTMDASFVQPDARGIEAIPLAPPTTMLRTVARRLAAGHLVFIAPDAHRGAAAAAPVSIARRLGVPAATCTSRIRDGAVVICVRQLPGGSIAEMVEAYASFLAVESREDERA
jgi:hypothetical protein